jgi:GTPase SAR1 family protein
VLNIVLIANQIELDNIGLSIVDMKVQQLKEDVGIQLDGLKVIRKVIVMSHRQELLHRRECRRIMNYGIHTVLIDGLLSLVLLNGSPFKRNGRLGCRGGSSTTATTN